MSILFFKNPLTRLKKPVRAFKRFQKDENGATAVEFAFVGGPFFLLIFAIIETSIFFWANQYLETVVDDVTRLYRTGRFVNVDPAWDLRSKQGFDAEICRRIVAMFDCDDLITQVDVGNDFINVPEPPRTDDAANFQGAKFSPPERFPPIICPLDIVQVTVSYEWPIFTNYSAPLVSEGLNDNALINVTAITRTENFNRPPGC